MNYLQQLEIAKIIIFELNTYLISLKFTLPLGNIYRKIIHLHFLYSYVSMRKIYDKFCFKCSRFFTNKRHSINQNKLNK